MKYRFAATIYLGLYLVGALVTVAFVCALMVMGVDMCLAAAGAELGTEVVEAFNHCKHFVFAVINTTVILVCMVSIPFVTAIPLGAIASTRFVNRKLAKGFAVSAALLAGPFWLILDFIKVSREYWGTLNLVELIQ